MTGTRVYIDTRDWWVGYYRGDTHHYVCPLPCVVIRWPRAVRPADTADDDLDHDGFNVGLGDLIAAGTHGWADFTPCGLAMTPLVAARSTMDQAAVTCPHCQRALARTRLLPAHVARSRPVSLPAHVHASRSTGTSPAHVVAPRSSGTHPRPASASHLAQPNPSDPA